MDARKQTVARVAGQYTGSAGRAERGACHEDRGRVDGMLDVSQGGATIGRRRRVVQSLAEPIPSGRMR
jgi:hypothetical protein